MTQLDELCQQVGNRVFWHIASTGGANVDEITTILKPIIAEARAQALEEAGRVVDHVCFTLSHHWSDAENRLMEMAEDARKEGAA